MILLRWLKIGNNRVLAGSIDVINSVIRLVHAQLLKAIVEIGNYDWKVREYVLGGFQQYLRNQSLFGFWNPQRDTPGKGLIAGNVFLFLVRGDQPGSWSLRAFSADPAATDRQALVVYQRRLRELMPSIATTWREIDTADVRLAAAGGS